MDLCGFAAERREVPANLVRDLALHFSLAVQVLVRWLPDIATGFEDANALDEHGRVSEFDLMAHCPVTVLEAEDIADAGNLGRRGAGGDRLGDLCRTITHRARLICQKLAHLPDWHSRCEAKLSAETCKTFGGCVQLWVTCHFGVRRLGEVDLGCRSGADDFLYLGHLQSLGLVHIDANGGQKGAGLWICVPRLDRLDL